MRRASFKAGTGNKSRMSCFFRDFIAEERGTIAILFGLSVILIVTIVGGATDYGRWLNAKSRQQQAMDAAALAAGRVAQTTSGDEAAVLAAARAYYDQAKSWWLTTDNAKFEIVDSGKAVRAVSEGSVATPFFSVIGIESLPVNVGAKVVLASGGNSDSRIEVALMLDVTGSMSGDKMEDLKLAAKDLVNIVVDDTDSQYSRVALAPFSEHVNVGLDYFEKVTGREPAGSSTATTCVRERQTGDRYTDEAPGAGNYFDRGPEWGWCKPYSTIMPLSGNKAALTQHIDGFETTGRTAGHLGTAWAWYLLSPKWNSVWGNTHAGPYNEKKLRKIAVLMTDGEYNKRYSGDTSAEQARAICTNMKAAGLIVYSVGFQITSGGEAYQTLQHCATDSSYFFNSTTGDELRQAFREIALQITTLRISK